MRNRHCGVQEWLRIRFPEGPKIKKIRDFRARLKTFEREWDVRATHRGPIFCGEIETSRMNISSEIEIFWSLGPLGFIICDIYIYFIFTVITLQDWVGWGIFTVIPGYPRRTNGDSQHLEPKLEARPELEDWLRSESYTVKNYRIGPFSK